MANRISMLDQVGIVALVLSVVLTGCVDKDLAKASAARKPSVTFQPREMADALHAVIAADRETYALAYAQNLPIRSGSNSADQAAANAPSLPLPAHLLRQASEVVQQQGAEFHYVLRSLWPINAKNGPETATERAGLEFVAKNPGTNYYAEESLGGRLYFTAIYPDKAINQTCVDCHNNHPATSKQDFRLKEVMGGLVVRVPLEF